MLRGARFSGNSVFTDVELQSLVADAVGKPVTLDDLDSIAKRITAMYRERGFVLAHSLVPVQEVQGGGVEFSVVEGALGKIELEVAPDAPIEEERLRAMLAPLQTGQPIDVRVYERAMLLISDLPGLKAQSALQASTVPGTTDLTVRVVKAPRVQGSIGIDDFGTREAGTTRLGASVRVNSPFGIGDNLDANALVSEHSNTLFGRVAYEAPLGARGLRIGGGAARVHYSLGGAFDALDALGTADVFDLSLSYPVIRQRNQNLFLRGFVDEKRLTDELRAVDFVSHKRVHGIGLGWAWERRDALLGGGYWGSSGALYAGRLDIRDPVNRAFDRGPFGPHTEGDFRKLSAKLTRLQAITAKNNVHLALGGQWADHNLDASEKFSLGGNAAVRAYPTGEVLVDRGWLATAEWRYALQADVALYAFYDAARGDRLRKPLDPAGNARSLRGPGIGLNWTRPGDFSADLSLAWRTTSPALGSGGDRKPRVFFRLQKFF